MGSEGSIPDLPWIVEKAQKRVWVVTGDDVLKMNAIRHCLDNSRVVVLVVDDFGKRIGIP